MDHFEGIRKLWKGQDMKIRDVTDKANAALDGADKKLVSLAEVVTRKGATKWVVLAAIVFAVALVAAMLLWPSKARATGYEHVVKVVIVKGASSPVVVAPAAVAPAAVVPATAAPAAAAPAASAPAVPAQQPASGGGSSWLASGGIAFIGSGIFLTAVGVSHFLFCAEDDKKKKEERVCYRPLRDGMP